MTHHWPEACEIDYYRDKESVHMTSRRKIHMTIKEIHMTIKALKRVAEKYTWRL